MANSNSIDAFQPGHFKASKAKFATATIGFVKFLVKEACASNAPTAGYFQFFSGGKMLENFTLTRGSAIMFATASRHFR